MGMPAFDAHGNLSVGRLIGGGADAQSLVIASLGDVYQKFVENWSARRASIWQGWMAHRSQLDAIGVPYHTFVNGSFVTTKKEPNDVDICVLLDAEAIDALSSAEQATLASLLDRPVVKQRYECDIYWVPVHPFPQGSGFVHSVKQVTYWTRVFGIDRLGRQKAFLLVPGGGVQ